MLGDQANSENLKSALQKMLDQKTRKQYAANVLSMTGGVKPAEKIAQILYNQINQTRGEQ